MKITLDLLEAEWVQLMKHTKVRTKTEAVSRAVAGYNRRERLVKLADKLGTFHDLITPEELRKMRAVN